MFDAAGESFLLPAQESNDRLGMAFAALLCSDTGVRIIPAPGTGFPQRADVQDEGDRRRDKVCRPQAGGVDLPEETKAAGSGAGEVQEAYSV